MADEAVTEPTPEQVATTAIAAATAPDESAPATTEAATQPKPPTFDEDFLKKLESLDPANLPQSLADKVVPKAEFTRKTQALAEERKRFESERANHFDLMRKVIQERTNVPTGPSAEEVKLKELQELAAAGDGNAVTQLAEMLAERKVAPIRTQVILQNAAQNARAANPAVVEHWNDIIETMQKDPVIAQMATINNYAGAEKVMIALGLEHQVRDMAPKLDALSKENAALKERLANYERERVTSLPASTAKAGTTAGRPTAGEPTTIEEIALRSWLEAGGTQDSFR